MRKESDAVKAGSLIKDCRRSVFKQPERNQRLGRQSQDREVSVRAHLIATPMSECHFEIVRKLLKQVFIYIHNPFDSASRTCFINQMYEASHEEIYKLCLEA